MGKKANDNNLIGMDAICVYLCGVTHNTILKWWRDYDLPIKNLKGTWVGSTVAIDKWFMTPAGQDASPETSKHREAKTQLDKEQAKPKTRRPGKK